MSYKGISVFLSVYMFVRVSIQDVKFNSSRLGDTGGQSGQCSYKTADTDTVDKLVKGKKFN